MDKRVIQILKSNYFANPSGINRNEILKQLEESLNSIYENIQDTPTYPRTIKKKSRNQIIQDAKIPLKICKNPKTILKYLYKDLQGSVIAGQKNMLKNIIPTASLPSLVTYLSTSLLMPNGVTAEDSGDILNSELSIASVLSRLAGYNENLSKGLMTFGGTGTNLYALRVALSKIYPNYSEMGLENNHCKIIEPKSSHYSHKTCASWLGIGTNNCIQINVNIDQTIKINELEDKIINLVKRDIKIVAIIVSGGTTSNMAIDDVKSVYLLRNRIVKKYNLDYVPHIHMDAVLGWVLLFFKEYDFTINQLKICDLAISQIKKGLQLISTIKYADSFGVDFHKSGYVHYTSSMIVFKNGDDLNKLKKNNQDTTPLFHTIESYNPGKISLETSRSAAMILSTWISIKTFGFEGYQALFANNIENGLNIKKFLSNESKKNSFWVIDNNRIGSDVFVRFYPTIINPKKQYEIDLKNDLEAHKYNNFNSKLFDWLDQINKERNVISVSKSSAAHYNHNGFPIQAIRIYPMSPYIDINSIKKFVSILISQYQEFLELFDLND